MIRDAKPQDVDYIVGVASKMARIHFPRLSVSASNIRRIVVEAISSPQCRVLVSFDEEGPKGALVSLCHDGVWFERKVSSLALIYSEIRGDGLKMLRIWKRFAMSRPAFKVVEVGFPARGHLSKILSGIGLDVQGFHLANMR